MVGKWNGSVDIYENHDRRLYFIFCIGAYAFSEQARTGKISSDCVPIPMRFRPVCKATLSLGKQFRRQNPPLPFLLSNLLFVYSGVFRFGACVEKCAGPKQLPVSILVLPCIRRGIGPVRSPCDRSALVAQYKNASVSRFCRRRNTIRIRKSISNRFGAVSRCLPQLPHWQP